MKDIRAVLFDAGGTLIHIDGERVCRAAGVSFESAAFRRADAEAVPSSSPAETGEPAAAEIVTGSTPDPAVPTPDAVEKIIDAATNNAPEK